MSKSKMLENALYGLTVVYGLALAVASWGDTSYVLGYLMQRAGFYLFEMVMLVIGMIRCSRLHSKYDYDYFKGTEKIFAAADCCFVLIAIITVLSVAAMLPIFLFLPKQVFEHGAANGLFVSLLIVGLIFLFYIIVSKRFSIVKKQREEMKHPLSEKTEDFFAFMHSADEKQQPANEEMPDASALLDDVIPDEDDFRRHLQRISEANALDVPEEERKLRECPSAARQTP